MRRTKSRKPRLSLSVFESICNISHIENGFHFVCCTLPVIVFGCQRLPTVAHLTTHTTRQATNGCQRRFERPLCRHRANEATIKTANRVCCVHLCSFHSWPDSSQFTVRWRIERRSLISHYFCNHRNQEITINLLNTQNVIARRWITRRCSEDHFDLVLHRSLPTSS